MSWDKEKLKKIVEGALFSFGQPMNIDRLSGLFFDEERPTRDEFKEALAELQEDYAERGVVLKEVASGYRFQVTESVGEWVSRLWEEKPVRYSRALLETLALVAYRQPITRGEIEEIRGVSVSSHIIKTLLERDWVRVVGHRDVPGRPAMFATTRTFLDYFNLKSLVELPSLSEIRDFDKINEELELEDVVPDEESTDEQGNNEENLEEGDAELVDAADESGEPGEQEIEPIDIPAETTDVAPNVVSGVVSSVAPDVENEASLESVTSTESEPDAPQANTLADIVRQFEANKAQEAETDVMDKAVASEDQLAEDLLVEEALERQLERGDGKTAESGTLTEPEASEGTHVDGSSNLDE